MSKVMVSLPEELLAAIDAEARASGRSRSGLLQYAARLYLAGNVATPSPGNRPEVRAAMARARRIVEQHGDQLSGDSTKFIRAARDARRGSGTRSTGRKRTRSEP